MQVHRRRRSWPPICPGVVAAHTRRPVIGLPLAAGPLQGRDALYSGVQMPPGRTGGDGGHRQRPQRRPCWRCRSWPCATGVWRTSWKSCAGTRPGACWPGMRNCVQSWWKAVLERYSRPEMARVWTLENKFRLWLEVEILAARPGPGLDTHPRRGGGKNPGRTRFSVQRILELKRAPATTSSPLPAAWPKAWGPNPVPALRPHLVRRGGHRCQLPTGGGGETSSTPVWLDC